VVALKCFDQKGVGDFFSQARPVTLILVVAFVLRVFLALICLFVEKLHFIHVVSLSS
jgi:hypothetical protein